jgi:hypothetical protein
VQIAPQASIFVTGKDPTRSDGEKNGFVFTVPEAHGGYFCYEGRKRGEIHQGTLPQMRKGNGRSRG